MRYLIAMIVLATLCTTAHARNPRLPDAVLGQWCLEDDGSQCAEVMIVTPSKVMWRGGGGEEGECAVKGVRARAKAWETDLVCYGEGGRERAKRVWSISGTRLIVNETHFVRRALTSASTAEQQYWPKNNMARILKSPRPNDLAPPWTGESHPGPSSSNGASQAS
jgi:hypothetical protein